MEKNGKKINISFTNLFEVYLFIHCVSIMCVGKPPNHDNTHLNHNKQKRNQTYMPLRTIPTQEQ